MTMRLLLFFWIVLCPMTASAQDLGDLLKHLSPAPDIQRVQHHALLHHRLLKLDDPRLRMRLSNLIPQVDLELGWITQLDQERRYREDLNRLDGGSMHRDFIRQDALTTEDTRRTVRVRLRLDLGKLVFDPREVQWRRHQRMHHQARQQLLRTVNHVYWQRKKHQLQLLLVDKDDLEQVVHHHIQVQFLTAQLNGLTGGWFGRQLRRRAK